MPHLKDIFDQKKVLLLADTKTIYSNKSQILCGVMFCTCFEVDLPWGHKALVWFILMNIPDTARAYAGGDDYTSFLHHFAGAAFALSQYYYASNR